MSHDCIYEYVRRYVWCTCKWKYKYVHVIMFGFKGTDYIDALRLPSDAYVCQ